MVEQQRITGILERTPAVLAVMLHGLDDTLIRANEGPETWSPFDVVGHLIHGERTDWIPRMKIILEHGTSRPFDPFDRTAQFRERADMTMAALLLQFRDLRKTNLQTLRAMSLKDSDFSKEGMHPALGKVTLGQLLSTWAAHDMDHLQQIARIIARQYEHEVGPWKEYLRILQH